MEISKRKIYIFMAEKNMSISDVAEKYGVTGSRIYVILNSEKVTPKCAGRLARALGVGVTDIIADE